jgi:hypothetical protein
VKSNEERTMTTSTMQIARGSQYGTGGAGRSGVTETWWAQRREASLNWLALGVLLAAWNASSNDAAQAWRRPPALRGYSTVSVRAATLHSVRRCAAQTTSGTACTARWIGPRDRRA